MIQTVQLWATSCCTIRHLYPPRRYWRIAYKLLDSTTFLLLQQKRGGHQQQKRGGHQQQKRDGHQLHSSVKYVITSKYQYYIPCTMFLHFKSILVCQIIHITSWMLYSMNTLPATPNALILYQEIYFSLIPWLHEYHEINYKVYH